MQAAELVNNLQAQGFAFRVDGDLIYPSHSAGKRLSVEDRNYLAEQRMEVIAILRRPRLGSSARPYPLISRVAPIACWFDECGGEMGGKGEMYQCGKCGLWFRWKRESL